MKVVIDTNVLLKMVTPRSSAYWMRKCLEEQKFILCVTTDILDEYEEILGSFYDALVAELFLDAIQLLPNIQYQSKSFWFRLIPTDEDDEKFADCAIATGADYLVTNDKHFNVLKRLKFPVVNVVSEEEFKEICRKKAILP